MPSAGDGVAWDTTVPTDSGEVSDTGLEIREVKKALESRNNKEHTTYGGSVAGGEHLAGSAKSFYQGSYPTKRPDTATDLDSNDAGRVLIHTDGPWIEIWNGTGWVKVVQPDATIAAAKLVEGIGSDILAYAVYANQLASGATTETVGTFNSGSWQTRVLNTEVKDAKAIGSLASNQITLAAGTYRVRAKAPALQVDYHQVRFYNTTDAATIEFGTSALSGANDTTQSYSEVVAEWTLGHTAVYELQHRCSTSKATVGRGAGPGTFGTVWYTAVVEIWKLK